MLGAVAWTLALASLLASGLAPATALSCFSCTDCSVGGALSAHKHQCGPTETYCAAVFRPPVGRWGHSSVDRGCASSLDVACASDGTVVDGGSTPEGGSTSSSHRCCSTDLCNGSGDARVEGYRRSEEHLRNLMEGNPRRTGKLSSDTGVGPAEEGTGDGNSAPSGRGAGGSRFATVLIIVGTFAQVLWLAGSLLQ